MSLSLIRKAYADVDSTKKAKVDTTAIKKRMKGDEKRYAGEEKNWTFWERLSLGLRNSRNVDAKKKAQENSADAKGAAFRTAGAWSARRDTLDRERAKSPKKK